MDRIYSKDRKKERAIPGTAVPNLQTSICISQVSAIWKSHFFEEYIIILGAVNILPINGSSADTVSLKTICCMERYLFPCSLFAKLGSLFVPLNLPHKPERKPKSTVYLDRSKLKAASFWPLSAYKECELTTTIFPSTSLLFIVLSLPFHFCTCTNAPFSKVTTLCKGQERVSNCSLSFAG